MRRHTITTSAGLGVALCVLAGSAAYADDADTSTATDETTPPVSVEIVAVPPVAPAAPPASADPDTAPGAPSSGTSDPDSAPPPPAAPQDAPTPDGTTQGDGAQNGAAASPADTSSTGTGSGDAAPEPSATDPAPSAADADAAADPGPGAGDPGAADPDPGDADAPDAATDGADDAPATDDSTSADPAGDDAVLPDAALADAALSGEGAEQLAAAAVITPLSAGQSVSTVADGLTPEQIVASLVGSGISVSNVVYTGAGSAFGIADGVGAIGINNGVVLSSGSVQVTPGDKGGLVGPNEDDGYSQGFGNPGDPDLAALAEATTYDAAVLEFDFVPSSSQLVFHYVFASEEYNEYVDAYNDVFAFYVNGVNCATVGGAPVSVNNINNEDNAALYVDNDLDDTDPAGPHDTEMDGFTRVLTCTASVNAGQSNHIKLAIADASDSALDSLVIIQQGSFSSQPPPVAVNDAYSTPVGQALVIVVPGLLGNDTQSPAGGALAAVKVTDPTNGTVTLNADGSFSYVPNAGFTGIDTFSYLVTDLWGNSNIATVTINVATGQVVPDVTPIATPPGTAVVTPVSGGGAAPAGTPISVEQHADAPDGVLASTGIDVAPLGAISVTLLGTGLAMLAAGRRRTSR